MRISEILNWCLFLIWHERSYTGMNAYYRFINLTIITSRYDRYPSFCGGLAYFMTKSAISNIAKSYSEGKDYLWLDDVFITGILSKKAGVHLIDWKVFQAFRLKGKLSKEKIKANLKNLCFGSVSYSWAPYFLRCYIAASL